MSDETYIPENDITQTLPDGREILVAIKGVAMPLAEAKRRGFVKADQPAGPSETKDAAESPKTRAK